MPDPIRSFKVDELVVEVYENQPSMAEAVTLSTRNYLVDVLERQGAFAAILATGNSQIEFLRQLNELGGVDWSKGTLFHMDEYLGIPGDHPASFRRYMKERVESLLTTTT